MTEEGTDIRGSPHPGATSTKALLSFIHLNPQENLHLRNTIVTIYFPFLQSPFHKGHLGFQHLSRSSNTNLEGTWLNTKERDSTTHEASLSDAKLDGHFI